MGKARGSSLSMQPMCHDSAPAYLM